MTSRSRDGLSWRHVSNTAKVKNHALESLNLHNFKGDDSEETAKFELKKNVILVRPKNYL